MKKVLIVDDDKSIREWVAFCISKRPAQYTVVGKAGDGSHGLALFAKELPDIVFTDVKMPVMSGLELLKKAKELKPDCIIFILSSYGEFEYARAALSNEAADYLLKTEITEADVFRVIESAESKLARAGTASGGLEKGTSLQIMREIAVSNILKGESPLPQLAKAGIRLDDTCFMAAIVGRRISAELVWAMNGFLAKHNGGGCYNVVWVRLSNDKLLVLANIRGEASDVRLRERAFLFFSSLQRALDAPICMGDLHRSVEYVAEAIREAANSADRAFYSGKSITEYGGGRAFIKLTGEHISVLWDLRKMLGENRIIDAMTCIEELLSGRFDWPQISEVDFKRYCVEILKIVKEYPGQVLIEDLNIDIQERIFEFESFEHLRSWITMLTSSVRERWGISSSCSPAIRKAVLYLKQNYNSRIALSEVAKHIGFSPEYFSRLFKKEMNINFAEYVLRLRMQKAIELLHQTDKKVYEIAEIAGYSSISYFSTVFKKVWGVSPYDYRNKQ